MCLEERCTKNSIPHCLSTPSSESLVPKSSLALSFSCKQTFIDHIHTQNTLLGPADGTKVKKYSPGPQGTSK